MPRSTNPIPRFFPALGVIVGLCVCEPASAQQVADTLFVPQVGKPLHAAGKGPVVLIDEAHHNFHTAEGRYLAFARVMRADGYVVRPNRDRFTRAGLEQGRILVIANALAAENTEEWVLPTPSAFDSSEIAAVKAWVHDGGALFLIADHMPFPGAAEDLARAFGIYMGNGFATIDGTDEGRITFSRAAGTLADHPITRGRQASERVDQVVTFMGQAFRATGAAAPLLTLDERIVLLMPVVAWQFSKLTPGMWAAGMQQGAVLQHGKGRVAVFGEAAMFTAQVTGPSRSPMGMNDPVARQNAQFLLNVVHWLEGE